MELWNEVVVEKSYGVLGKLKKEIDFVIIGGWASWFYSRTVKSKDIDMYVNFKDFFSFQENLARKGIYVSLNKKLRKYEAKIGDVDIDIYTPEYCDLIIPCKDVFVNKWFKSVDGFKVVLPEVFLVLKLKAEQERSGTIKGFKDRVDILSLIYKLDLDKKFLLELERKYGFGIKEKVLGVIKGSGEEFKYFFDDFENLRSLKKLRLELVSKV